MMSNLNEMVPEVNELMQTIGDVIDSKVNQSEVEKYKFFEQFDQMTHLIKQRLKDKMELQQ